MRQPLNCLNPRFVGRVFRQAMDLNKDIQYVLIPDLWGESSDVEQRFYRPAVES